MSSVGGIYGKVHYINHTDLYQNVIYLYQRNQFTYLYRGISSRDQIFGRCDFGALLVQYLIAGY